MLRSAVFLYTCTLSCVSLSTEALPDPATATFDSIPAAWQGESIAHHEWIDERGQAQRLDLCRRKDGTLFYMLHALSAVCGDAGKESSCKIHRFDACFDELGRFLGLRVDNAQPFTKTKHEPFKQKDYELLDCIARDPMHVIGSLGAKSSGVDTVSGATIAYLAEKSVPGAFYTSRTVWLIAQRTTPERIQAWTIERLTADDVKAWQAKGEALKLWWFLDHAGDSTLSSDTQTDLAYQLLAFAKPEVQTAAIRCLQRIGATFQPERAQSNAYTKMDDAARPEFLAWWQSQRHAPNKLVTAVLKDLKARAEESSPATVPALKYLAALGLTRSEDARATLKALVEKNPSTFVRRKAAEILTEGH